MVKVVEMVNGIGVVRVMDMKVNGVEDVFNIVMLDVERGYEEEMYFIEGEVSGVGMIRYGEDGDMMVIGEDNVWFDKVGDYKNWDKNMKMMWEVFVNERILELYN